MKEILKQILSIPFNPLSKPIPYIPPQKEIPVSEPFEFKYEPNAICFN